MEKRRVNSSAASPLRCRKTMAATKTAVPRGILAARAGLNPRRQASQSARGASSKPCPASLSFHQSRTSVVAGRANKIAAARIATAIGAAPRGSQLAKRGGDWGRAVTAGSPASPAEQHDGDRLEHDLEVFQQPLPLNVLQIVLDLPPHVVEALVVVMIDLREAGDAGLGPLAERVLCDILGQLGEDRGPLGAGAHDVHLTLEHVEQLGQLVEPVLAQKAA